MKVTLQVDEKKTSFKRPMRPTEGDPFEVNPPGINRTLFQVKREDPNQETMRQLILEAFTKKDENPEKYGKPFKTLMPEKTWDWKTVGELKELATKLGDHIADWVEQALEWAQRIQNGETWEAICNEPDTAKWYRLVQWKNGCYGIVGGARRAGCPAPATIVLCKDRDRVRKTQSAVPLVVLYK